MAEFSNISWTHASFNPWIGCEKVSPACDHCYAETWDARFNKGESHWGPRAQRRRTSLSNWAKPLKWNRQAVAMGRRIRVFCASLADVFDNKVEPAWRVDLANLVRATPMLDWMILTKRIGNVERMIARDFGGELPANVWLGATVATQSEADRDIARLLDVPASVHWLSMEPLLERVVIAPEQMAALDMIVVGGESGKGARHMDLSWATDLLDQARAGDCAYHFKQMSQFDEPTRYENTAAFPAKLRVREFPAGTYAPLAFDELEAA